MAKKQKKPEEKTLPTWLASYADLFTVLFAMFVLLYALSDVDEERFAQFAMVASGRSPLTPLDFGSDGINNLLGSGLMDLPMFDFAVFTDPSGQPGDDGNQNNQNNQNAIEIAADILQTYFADSAFAERVEVLQISDSEILLSFYDNMFFNSGSASILPPTFPVLDIVFEAFIHLLETNPNIEIRIEGHTDNVPINTAQFPSNWQLSQARAMNILQHLLGLGIPGASASAIGFGEYRPIASNETAQGRQMNRRVEIRIFDTLEIFQEYNYYLENNG